MHNILKAALPAADGRSEFVIVVVADIRGFSAFSLGHESPEVAMYIKRVYIRLIEKYFPFANFYKSTGDGLLMAIQFNEANLQEKAQEVASACLLCLKEFPYICRDDAMINFEVPSRIGFGVTRGTACCLISGKLILDYSGQILNLASRLTDLARPSGIVIDGFFGIGQLLSKEHQKLFERQKVYIRSVAEEKPRDVYVLKGAVHLPEQAKRPIQLERREIVEWSRTFREWKDVGSRFAIPLQKNPKRPDDIEVWLSHILFKGRKAVEGMIEREEFRSFNLMRLANRPLVEIAVDTLVERLREKRIPQETEVKLTVSYVPQ